MALPSSSRVARALPPLALILVAITAVAIVAIDQPLARALADDRPSPIWKDWLAALDRVTGLTWWKWLPTVVIIAVAVLAQLTPRLRPWSRGLALVAIVHVVTKAVLFWSKPGLGRLRPREWLARGGDTTFGFDGGIAFPSGHTGHYLSIALPLAVAWPRLGLPLLIVPIFASASRLATDSHFLSDLTGGAALVVALTWLTARSLRVAR